jgi:hypothetical protein
VKKKKQKSEVRGPGNICFVLGILLKARYISLDSIGVTPFRSMIKYTTDEQLSTKIVKKLIIDKPKNFRIISTTSPAVVGTGFLYIGCLSINEYILNSLFSISTKKIEVRRKLWRFMTMC